MCFCHGRCAKFRKESAASSMIFLRLTLCFPSMRILMMPIVVAQGIRIARGRGFEPNAVTADQIVELIGKAQIDPSRCLEARGAFSDRGIHCSSIAWATSLSSFWQERSIYQSSLAIRETRLTRAEARSALEEELRACTFF